MARRVNTKFVIILSSVLLLIALGALLMLTSNFFNTRDPVWLKKKAKEAEDAKNWPAALTYYGMAAQRSARTHEPDTADLYFHAGQIAMDLSGQESDPIKAQRNYDQALQDWQAALTENSKFLPAQQKFLEQRHLQADLFRESGVWSALRDAANKVIAVDPKSADAYLYRAQASFQLLQNISGSGSVSAGLKDIEADIAKAIELSPDKADTIVLKSVVMEFEAQDAQSRGLLKDADKLRQGSLAALHAFLDKHPHNPEVSLRLAQITGNGGNIPEMIKVIREAYQANVGNPLLGEALASVDRYTDRVEAEKVLKELVAAHPDSTDSYRRLAAFYQEGQRYDDALQASKDVLTHLEPGGGVIGIRRNFNMMEALYNLCWINMDKAERPGIPPAEAKANLAEAVAFTDRFRGNSPPRASVSLLDGRMHFLRDQIPAAIIDLHNADVAFSLGNTRAPQWIQTKTLLAECFEKQFDWGTALTYYDQILKAEPTRVPIMLRRAMVLNKVGKYSEAVAVIDRLSLEKLPESMRTYAQTIKATGLDGLGQSAESQKIFASIDSPIAKLNVARSMAMDNDLPGALEQLNDLLAKHPDNEIALNMAILINMQLTHREEAQKLLDIAIAKFPKNTQFQVMQAALKTQSGDSMQAQIEVLKTIPDDYTRFITLAQFYRQLSSHEKDPKAMRGDHENELASLEQAYSKIDNSDANHDNYALVVERIFNLSLEMAATAATPDEKNKYFDIAQKYVAVADRDNLDGVNGKLYQGRLEYLRDDPQKGIKTLEQAVTQRPDFSAGHAVLGRAYMEAHEDDAALDQFHQAIAQNPANLQAIKMAITVLYKKYDTARLPEAQQLLKDAYRIAPHDSQLAAFNDVLGDPSDAIRVRKKAFDETPVDKRNTPDSLDNTKRLAMLYVRRADLIKTPEEKKQSLQQAIELLRPLYDKKPDDLETADVLARLYKQTDQTNNALTMYERFLASKDKTVVFDAMLLEGDMYHSMGNDDQAVNVYKEAIGLQTPGNDQAERRLADQYFETNDMADAEIYYQKIYDREQVKDMRVLRRLAEALIRQATAEKPQKYAAADDLFNALFKIDPNDAEGIVLQGFSFFKQNKQEQAIASFNKILSDPTTAGVNSHYRTDALYYRAFARLANHQDLDQAIKDLELVRTQTPDNLNARLLLARIYREARHYAESTNEYSQLLIAKPDFGVARLEYVQFLFQLAQIQKQLPAESQEDIAYVIRNINPSDTLQAVLTDAEKRYPQQSEWLVVQGDLYGLIASTSSDAATRARYAGGAQQTYAAAFNLAATAFDSSGGDPQAVAPFLNAAGAYLNSLMQSRSNDDVIAVASAVIAQQPKIGDAYKLADTYVKRAAAYAAKKKTTEAAADVTQAVALAGAYPSLAMDIARESVVAVSPDVAIGILQKRLDSNKDEAGTRLALAQAQIGNNQPGDAVKTVAPVRDDASMPAAVKLLAVRISALGKYEAKDYDDAQADYKELLKEDPNDIESLNNMAFMLADDLKRPRDGLPYADRAFKIVGSTSNSLNLATTGNVLDTHGWVLYLGGDTMGSISDLSRAVALAPLPVTYLHLATVYQKAGRSDEAAKAVAMGIQLSSKSDPSLGGLQALQSKINAH